MCEKHNRGFYELTMVYCGNNFFLSCRCFYWMAPEVIIKNTVLGCVCYMTNISKFSMVIQSDVVFRGLLLFLVPASRFFGYGATRFSALGLWPFSVGCLLCFGSFVGSCGGDVHVSFMWLVLLPDCVFN